MLSCFACGFCPYIEGYDDDELPATVRYYFEAYAAGGMSHHTTKMRGNQQQLIKHKLTFIMNASIV